MKAKKNTKKYKTRKSLVMKRPETLTLIICHQF